MKNIRIKGGLAAFICAGCYFFGLLFYLVVFQEAIDKERAMTVFLEKQLWYEIWIIVVYMVFAGSLLYLSQNVRKVFGSFGLGHAIAIVWTAMLMASGSVALVGLEAVADKTTHEDALQLWEVVSIVQDALGGGIEWVGGLWSVLMAFALYRNGNRLLSLLGWLTGFLGIITAFSPFRDWVVGFGLLQLLFFTGLGFWLLVKHDKAALQKRDIPY